MITALMLALAQGSNPMPPPPPARPVVDCSDADHRAFDFWLGDWDVSPTGSTKVIAQSHIEKIVDCAISETFVQTLGPGGKTIDYRGRSISSFNPADLPALLFALAKAQEYCYETPLPGQPADATSGGPPQEEIPF